MNKDFFAALEDLEREKKINKEFFIEALESALTSAYKKNFGEAKSASVRLNPEKNSIKVYSYKTIVEEVVDSDKEISLEDAKKIKKSYAVGDIIAEEVTPKEFGRIAAQIAKQVVLQRLREAEHQVAMSELSEKQNELVTCVVRRIEAGVVYVEIPGSKTEGVMNENDQIPGENYQTGDRIKVYVKNIKDSTKSTYVSVSRSNAGFVKRLFELEVPEIKTGEIEVKNISREAGYRTKMAVSCQNPNVDVVGACVGNKGMRINAIVNELNGEKIDIIEYCENPLEYIARALSPAKVITVYALEGNNYARAVVPDDKLSLAIGKNGQNVRLAVKLTGWKIDVKSESVAKQIDGELFLNIEKENYLENEDQSENFDISND
ncbi:MAG: transcription termination/antitermination protein NusA [Clostridia bacterium]|nr:transcription termination/antitermination protein NusA [Clostridia bacterium]